MNDNALRGNATMVKMCGPTAGCGRSMQLDARYCPYCGKDQGGYTTTFYPLAPGQSLIPTTLSEPIHFTILPGACVPVSNWDRLKAIGFDTT